MSLIEMSKDEEIDRLHAVIDAQIFGPRAKAVRDLQIKIRFFAEAFDALDRLLLSPEACEILKTCKFNLGMLERPDADLSP